MNIREKRNLDDGDICLVEVTGNWNKLGYGLAVFSNNRFYDQFVIEEDQLEMSDWDITDRIKDYFNTGLRYERNNNSKNIRTL